MSPAVEVCSLNHWPVREVPKARLLTTSNIADGWVSIEGRMASHKNSCPPKLQNVTLFRNRSFADVRTQGSGDEIILASEWAPNPVTVSL